MPGIVVTLYRNNSKNGYRNCFNTLIWQRIRRRDQEATLAWSGEQNFGREAAEKDVCLGSSWEEPRRLLGKSTVHDAGAGHRIQHEMRDLRLKHVSAVFEKN